MTTNEFREQFFALVSEAQHIAITAHKSPDDDSIASVLSVYELLTTLHPEKRIEIIYPGPGVDRWKSFQYFDRISFVDDIANHLEASDLLVVLDLSGSFDRLTARPEVLLAIPQRIAIDHHASPLGPFTLSQVTPTYTSNAEHIFHLLIDGVVPLTKSLAEALLLGIIGDTGSFAHVPPNQSQVFLVAKQLLEIVGVSIGEFRSRYGSIPMNVFPIIQELMKNTHFETINGWPPFQYAVMDRAALAAGGYSDEDMSAASHIYLSNYLPRIEGYTWGFVATPRTDGSSRISSRSLPGSVNVRMLHEALAVGGGHDRASGAYLPVGVEPKDGVEQFKAYLRANPPLL